MRLFVSGFEPFRSLSYNPSADCARAIAAHFEGARFEEWPVDFAFVSDRTLELAAESWDLVVHIGVAASRNFVAVEELARNEKGGEADARAGTTGSPKLELNGPELRRSSFRAKALVDGLGPLTSWPVRPCQDAGNFVCNATLFHSLGAHQAAVTFIHVPMMTPQQASELGRAIACAIEAMEPEGFKTTWR